MTAKKWAITTIAITLSLLLVLASITFIVDPLYQYRYSQDSGYFLNPRYVCPGLVKTYEYDSVMLGSSMTQNFDPDLFEEKMGLDLLKVNVGGMSVPETLFYLEYIDSADKADTVFVSVDLQRYALTAQEANFNIPEYLANGYTDDYRYLLSSDVYTRFLPIDIVIMLMDMLNIEKPDSVKRNTDVDELGSWYSEHDYGEDVVLSSFKTYGFGISLIKNEKIETVIKDNIDSLFLKLSELDTDTEYYLFFPPYSALYWIYTEQNNLFDAFMNAKEYIFEKASMCENITVYDFQNLEITTDLSNYKDVSHYSKAINDYMVDCFANESYLVSSAEQLKQNREGITQKRDMTNKKYRDFLDKYDE